MGNRPNRRAVDALRMPFYSSGHPRESHVQGSAMKRVATFADGWMPAGVPIDAMAQMMEGIRGMAQEAGRDSSVLKLVVRANVHVTPQTQGDQRQPFYGSLDEIKSDIRATRDIGADELFIDPGLSGVTSVEVYLEVMEQFKDLIDGA